MPVKQVKRDLPFAGLCLVLFTMLLSTATALAADIPDGLYLKDDRNYHEIGLVCRLDLQETGPGLWHIRITAANPALCGGLVEGAATWENGAALFRDSSCPDQGDSGDCCALKLTFSQDAVTVTGPPCLAEQCPLAGTYYRYGALIKPVDQIIKDIRAHYYQTNKIIDQLDLDQKNLKGPDDQPQGLVKVYSDLGYPKKIAADLQMNGARLVEEYYYFDRVLLFCFRLTYPDRQKGAAGPPREDRFYFHQDKLIRWLGHDKKEVPSTDKDFQNEQNRILSSSARYLEMADN